MLPLACGAECAGLIGSNTNMQLGVSFAICSPMRVSVSARKFRCNSKQGCVAPSAIGDHVFRFAQFGCMLHYASTLGCFLPTGVGTAKNLVFEKKYYYANRHAHANDESTIGRATHAAPELFGWLVW